MGAPKQMRLFYRSLSPASLPLTPSFCMSFICMSSFTTSIYHLFASCLAPSLIYLIWPHILMPLILSLCFSPGPYQTTPPPHHPSKTGLVLFTFQLFIGFGFPYEGPAPLEAIANGCIFLQPKFQPPHSSLNHEFFRGKPTSREVSPPRALPPRRSRP